MGKMEDPDEVAVRHFLKQYKINEEPMIVNFALAVWKAAQDQIKVRMAGTTDAI